MASKTIKRASRDLFSVCLDLDIICFKLDNIEEDLEESAKNYSAEELQIAEIRGALKKAQALADEVRRGWNSAKD